MVNPMDRRIMFIIFLAIVSVVTPFASAVNIPNDATTPDTTGFNVYGPDKIKVINNYYDPVIIINYTIENTIKHPYVLRDASGNYVNTFKFDNASASGVISVSNTTDGGYIMVVNTSTNVTNSLEVPAGVPLSQSGVWKKGVVTFSDLGVSIVFWVIDTTTHGVYDTVIIDIAGDNVDLQKFTLYDTHDMVVPDDFHSIMRLQVLAINASGDTITVRNLFDTLNEGDYSPFDGSKLQSVLMPHYVIASFVPSYSEITKIELVNENGTPIESYDPYTTITINESSHNVTIVTLLGEFESGNIYVPGKKTFYFAVHLKPVVNISERIQLSDSDYMYYVYLNNTNNVDLGPGYINITNVAPASALSQIQDSLSVIPSDYVKAVASSNNYSVTIELYHNATLPAGVKRTIIVRYKYTDPLTAKVDSILKYLKEINQTTHINNAELENLATALVQTNNEISNLKQLVLELKGIVENGTNNNEPVNVEVNMTEIINMLNDLKNGQVQMSQDIGSISQSITTLGQQLQELTSSMQQLSTNVDNMKTTLDTIVQLLSQGGNTGSSQVNVNSILADNYIVYLSGYTQYLDGKIQEINAQLAQNNGTSVVSNDIARLTQIKQDLESISDTLLNVVDNSYSTSDEKIIAVMAYISQANSEITEANILLSKIELELMNSGAGDKQVINDLKTQLDTIQKSLNALSSKVDNINSKIVSQNTGGATTGVTTNGTATATTTKKVNPMIFLGLGALVIVLAVMLMLKKKKEGGSEEEGEWEEEEGEEFEEEEEEF